MKNIIPVLCGMLVLGFVGAVERGYINIWQGIVYSIVPLLCILLCTCKSVGK